MQCDSETTHLEEQVTQPKGILRVATECRDASFDVLPSSLFYKSEAGTGLCVREARARGAYTARRVAGRGRTNLSGIASDENEQDEEGKKQFSVTRKQFSLTPAYASTDYRAQGQTLSKVVVDIHPPPTGGSLTNFKIYLALSRSRGRDGIRLLRAYDRDAMLKQIPSFLAEEDEQTALRDAETKRMEKVTG